MWHFDNIDILIIILYIQFFIYFHKTSWRLGTKIDRLIIEMTSEKIDNASAAIVHFHRKMKIIIFHDATASKSRFFQTYHCVYKKKLMRETITSNRTPIESAFTFKS